jgi:hypothetical protein
MAQELQTLSTAWFQKVRNGLEVRPSCERTLSAWHCVCNLCMRNHSSAPLQDPYDVQIAKADQEKILTLFETLREELRKTGDSLICHYEDAVRRPCNAFDPGVSPGLENLFVDKMIKTGNGMCIDGCEASVLGMQNNKSHTCAMSMHATTQEVAS